MGKKKCRIAGRVDDVVWAGRLKVAAQRSCSVLLDGLRPTDWPLEKGPAGLRSSGMHGLVLFRRPSWNFGISSVPRSGGPLCKQLQQCGQLARCKRERNHVKGNRVANELAN